MGQEEKLKVLGASATEDQDSSPPSTGRGCAGISRPDFPGIFPARLPGGKTFPLMRVLQTNVCTFSCRYCATRAGRDIPRASFRPEELARIFLEAYRRGLARGLFLTSGIPGSPVRMMDRLLNTVEILRLKAGFDGYIHLKILPGCEPDQIRRACELASRVSLNLEAPGDAVLERLAPEKHWSADLVPRLRLAGEIAQEERARREEMRRWNARRERGDSPPIPGGGSPSGVTTQFVVGPAGESDRDLLEVVGGLLGRGLLHHAHFSPFVPVKDTPLEGRTATPRLRSHRLYQAEFLLRFYGFGVTELPFQGSGMLPLTRDPKEVWAFQHPEAFPVEVLMASREELLRVPGIGPGAATRIVSLRRLVSPRDARDLERLGIRMSRAAPFLTLAGRILAPPARRGPSGARLTRGAWYPELVQPELWDSLPREGCASPGAFR